MLASNRRGTLALYFIFGLVILILMISGAVTSVISGLLFFVYALFVIFTARSWNPDQLPYLPMAERTPKFTEAARQAAGRVSFNSALVGGYLQLQDIGVIIDERRRDGIMLRRARFLSMDEESIRPYIVLHNTSSTYSTITQYVVVRFELVDSAGKTQFIYEMEHFLKPGENLILADYRLRLKENDNLKETGGWEMIVNVNDQPVGIHRFNLLPAASDRLRQAAQDGEVPVRLILEEEAESLPLSLEELLSQQNTNA